MAKRPEVRSTKRIVLRSLIRALLTTTALVVLYYELPLRGKLTDAAIVLLPVGLAGFGYLSYRGVRGVLDSPTPRVMAIQVLATVVPFFVIVMAATYYLMEAHQTKAFNVPLTRTDALYFTVTVFATVGFGDIVPVSEGARIVAMVQMLGGFAIIGAGVQVLTSAVRMNVERRKGAGVPDPIDDDSELR